MTIDVSKVRYISLIRLEGGESVLNVPYAEMTVDPDLIAGFVTAVIIFANTPIRTIRKQKYDILIEVGKNVLVLLVVDPVPDESPYRTKLKTILAQVEEEHGTKLKEFEGDIRRYREFTLQILTEFPYYELDLNLVPVKTFKDIKIPFRVASIDRKLEQIEAFIDKKRTIMEILDLIDMPEEEVLALIGALLRYQHIDLKRKLTEQDKPIVTKNPPITCTHLRAQYGKPVDDLLEKFDGKITIQEVINGLPYDKAAIWFLINKLVDEGCLKPRD